MSYQKIKPYRDKKYLAWIRTKPCTYCGRSKSEYLDIVPAHQNFEMGSMGSKASDLYTIPLCTDCHLVEHTQGHDTFWGLRDLKLEVLKLINEYMGR